MFLIFFALNSSSIGFAATLTLSQALNEGLKSSLEVQQKESDLKVSQSEYQINRSKLLPTLDLKASVGQQQTNISNQSYDVNKVYLLLSQPLYQGGALTSGLKYSNIERTISSTNFRLQKTLYAYQITKAYLTASAHQSLLKHAKDNNKALQDYALRTSRYAQIGRSKQIDRLSAQANYELSQAEVLNVENILFESYEDLSTRVGSIIDSKTDLEDLNKNPVNLNMDIESLLLKATANNPELKSLELQVDSLKEKNKVKLSEHFPYLTLDGTYGYDSPSRSHLFSENSEVFSIFLNLKIPLFSGFSYSNSNSVYSEQLIQLQRDLEIKKRDIKNAIAKSVAGLKSNLERLKYTKTSTLNAAQAMALALRDYKNGLVSSSEVFQIQNTKYNADKQNINAILNYNLQILELNYILGKDLERGYLNEN